MEMGKTISIYIDDEVAENMESIDENWSKVCNQFLKEYISKKLPAVSSAERDKLFQISYLMGIEDGKRNAQIMSFQELRFWKDLQPNSLPTTDSWNNILAWNNRNPNEFDSGYYVQGWVEGVKSVAKTQIH